MTSAAVLLLGGGPGVATSGVVYLASYLRRHGVAATVRPHDDAETFEALAAGVAAYVEATKPQVVGISLKWFLHVYRALLMARVVKQIDPSIRVVLGGDTASRFAEQLARFDCVDHVVRGDGEAPLLAIARGDVPADQPVVNDDFAYLQDRDSAEVYYSHFDEIFVCARDRHAAPAFVVGGKGCSQSCGYCGGARTAQRENFGRKRAYLRPIELVRDDVVQLERLGTDLIYDFSDHPLGRPAEYFAKLWDGVDLSRSGIVLFPWRVPPLDLVDLMVERHGHVTLNLDFGCLSERQRLELMRRKLLKPLPADDAYFEVIEHCKQYDNLRLRVSAVAALPYLQRDDLAAERRIVERLVEQPQLEYVLYDWVHSQPGAPLTEAPEAHGMIAQVQGFDELLAWNEAHAPLGEYDPALMYHRSGPDAFRPDTQRSGGGYSEGKNRAILESFVAVKRVAQRAEARFALQLPELAGYWTMHSWRFERAPRCREVTQLSRAVWLGPFDTAAGELDEALVLMSTGHMWSPGLGRSLLSERSARRILPKLSAQRSVADVLAALGDDDDAADAITPDQLGAAVVTMAREGVIRRA